MAVACPGGEGHETAPGTAKGSAMNKSVPPMDIRPNRPHARSAAAGPVTNRDIGGQIFSPVPAAP